MQAEEGQSAESCGAEWQPSADPGAPGLAEAEPDPKRDEPSRPWSPGYRPGDPPKASKKRWPTGTLRLSCHVITYSCEPRSACHYEL